MPKKILLQFDTGDHASSFDSVVAIDSGVDHLLTYRDVHPSAVRGLVHGAMFTRGGDDLASTAIFIGGEDVLDAEKLLQSVCNTFFGPVRVSVMLDAGGCNTTASAAVVAAGRHVELGNAKAAVLGGTGPVGRRVAQLLAGEGADVVLTSRSQERAEAACQDIREKVGADQASTALLTAAAPRGENELKKVMADRNCVIACGAAGVQLLSAQVVESMSDLAVAIDLNAVPPAGIEGVSMTDKAVPVGGGVGYGAIGVGGLKMRTHVQAIERLFTANDLVLDAEEIYAIAKTVG
ncbi:NAD(P)-dependent methylenetetrahydromethanopterin dehydrogenase [Crateriforma conspicua]|uniref:NAD(P)-dependent methylenetetrahydromethanopterin dehydrogenase n=1 Tax=Crateriforma conspicua TaxID=2527996 RepID=UPI00118B447A|nr:NAD(P)-dependent methylenetetrahydromethanopterin dehydrogenase [Crateriforma conspicua]QDV62791.1 Bifunctional protein MdtA [Crateriforma conspicua]